MRRAMFLLLLCASASAQVYEVKNCVYREGDDPAWARPDYDDSGWSIAPSDPLTAAAASPWVWERCRLKAPRRAVTEPLYLQIDVTSAWILYVNGRPAASFGDPETGRFTLDTIREVLIAPGSQSGDELTIALRCIRSHPILNRISWLGLATGSKNELELRAARARVQALLAYVPAFVPAVTNLGVAVLLLILALSGSSRRDALLLGGLSLSQTAVMLVGALVAVRAPASVSFYIGFVNTARIVGLIAPFFAYFLLGRTTPRIFRFIFVFAGAVYAGGLTTISLPVAWAFPAYGLVLRVAPFLALVQNAGLITAFFPWRNYTPIERFMFAPNSMAFAGSCFVMWALVFSRPLLPTANFVLLVSGVLFNLFYAVVIALRFRRVNDEHQSLRAEMRAAREVQRRLVPEAPSVPGFRIDTAYLPAKEVGGDFYHLLPGDDGSLLVVVGDVSGKGLDAAMVVAVAVGALGGIKARSPRAVLSDMNDALIGKTRGGFVTCCCALFRADGAVEIANAGHIPPYMQGRELELAPGPPLGIVPDAKYEYATVSPGAGAITFLSDGVVEATNARGELLGFDRLAGLSVKPAKEIAQEAERWGQEDDITVVQVAYAS